MKGIKMVSFLIMFFFISYTHVWAARAKIGIPTFENKARVDRSVADSFVDMLTTAFVKSRKFDVIERSSLSKIANEQALGASGAISADSAAQIGKLAGVSYMVIGIISQLGYSKKNIGAFGVHVSRTEASIGIDIRLVDTTTGKIMLAESFTKKKNATGIGGGYVNVDLSSGPLSELAREICNEIVKKVMFTVYPPKVVKVKGNNVMINYGESVISKGQVYTVFKKGEELIDPDTGESLGAEEEEVGTVKITRVTAKFSVGEILNSKQPIKAGMLLRPREVTKKKYAPKVKVPW